MIRDAQAEDIPRLAEIHISGWRFAYRGIISDFELFQKRTVQKSINNFHQLFEKQSQILIYEDEINKITKGFAIHGTCRDLDVGISHEIYAIYVQPEFTKLSIGTQLVNEIKKISKIQNHKELYVWVLDKNKIGKEFYTKLGFKKDGIEKTIEEWNAKEIRMALTTAST